MLWVPAQRSYKIISSGIGHYWIYFLPIRLANHTPRWISCVVGRFLRSARRYIQRISIHFAQIIAKFIWCVRGDGMNGNQILPLDCTPDFPASSATFCLTKNGMLDDISWSIIMILMMILPIHFRLATLLQIWRSNVSTWQNHGLYINQVSIPWKITKMT